MEQATQIAQPMSPQQELEQLRTDRAAGKIDDWSWRNGQQARFEALAEQSVAGTAAPSLSQQQAQTQLDTLRAQRAAGTVSDQDFWTQMEQLGPLAAGEQPGAPQPQLTIEQQLEAQIDEQMAGARPQDYQFESSSGHQMTDEDLAFDSEVRAAFSDMQIPKHLGGPIFEAIDQVGQQLRDATPGERGAKIAEVIGALKQQWGDDFYARRDAIDERLASAAAKHPKVDELLYGCPWLLADIRVWQWLDLVAQHAGKSARR